MRAELLANENACALIMCIISKEEISVEAALKQFGVGATNSNKGVKKESQLRLKESDLEEVKRLYYEEYNTIPQVAKIFNVSQGTVAHYMKSHGLQARPKGWGRFNSDKKNKEVKK